MRFAIYLSFDSRKWCNLDPLVGLVSLCSFSCAVAETLELCGWLNGANRSGSSVMPALLILARADNTYRRCQHRQYKPVVLDYLLLLLLLLCVRQPVCG